MLSTLYISSYALISELTLDLSSGFSVITGETGAGKSILLGALSLLRGGRADAKVIQAGAKKCIVEATFRDVAADVVALLDKEDIDIDTAQPEVIIRREVAVSGKSRAFINDTPVLLTTLRDVSDRLVDIHSQHQNLLLSRTDFLRSMLDRLAFGHDSRLLDAFAAAYQRCQEARSRLQAHIAKVEQARAQYDYNLYQLQQIDALQLHPDEQCTLEAERDALTHGEDIRTALATAAAALEGSAEATGQGESVANRLRMAEAAASDASRFMPEAASWSERLNSVRIEVDDLWHDISRAADSVEVDPRRLEAVEERLDAIYTLLHKHKCDDLAALLAYAESLRQQCDAVALGEEHTAALQREAEAAAEQMQQTGQQLTAARQAAAQQAEGLLVKELQKFGMPHVQLQFQFVRRAEPDASGYDTLHLMFAANKGGVVQDVADVASGGEIARVMLVLKALVATHTQLPTIIFDEIDTGVSGTMAERMGHIMQQMAATTQVLCITHLPQIAAQGAHHYLVEKVETATATASEIRPLDDKERLHEIANMLSGAEITAAALNNAQELLGLTKRNSCK